VGEIKSTLDLVMERTKNLTLSSREKQAQKQKETESRIKGLVQKLQDGLLTTIQLKVEYESFKKASGLADDRLLASEIIARIDPDQDSQILLEILEECCNRDAARIRGIIDDYRTAYKQAARKRSAQLKEDLEKHHSIIGTAVIPNLEADEEWQRQVRELRNGLEDSLSQAQDR